LSYFYGDGVVASLVPSSWWQCGEFGGGDWAMEFGLISMSS